jgi:(R,R)-butanediol dehydrogenase/meso-butanediol dehydrogenase/diacetyl reductase/L-iditol 2-dehydrogenase
MSLNRIWQVVEPGRVAVTSRDLKALEPGELRVRIMASAICGSDLHIFKGKHPSAPLPVTIGHEFSGEVVETGEGVSGLRIGDRVTVEPVLVCGTCAACLTGNYGYCKKISYTYRSGDGAMADFITVRQNHVFVLPDHLSYEAGTLIEPLAVAVHAVRRADIGLGEKVLVIGAGAIGILIAALCRKNGATQVVVADYAAHRLGKALEMGATSVVNLAGKDLYAAVDELTECEGMDKTFECVGLEKTFNQAMMTLRKNGLATIVGIFEEPEIRISASRFITHEIRVQGSQGYCWDFPVALELSRDLDLQKLVSHEFELENMQKALDTCLDAQAGAIKVVMKPWSPGLEGG